MRTAARRHERRTFGGHAGAGVRETLRGGTVFERMSGSAANGDARIGVRERTVRQWICELSVSEGE